MAEWSLLPFEQILLEPVRNGIYKQKQFHGSGCKIVNMGELFAHPRLRAIPMKRVELNESEQKRFGLAENDLIFARRSLTAEGAGKCSIVLELDHNTTFESSIIRARPDPSKASSLFLYYFFNSPVGLHRLDTIRRQVAVAGITGSDLSKLKIPVPSIEEQRAIASVLGALDDKIDLNRRMNETLEAMARAIFMDKQEKCDGPESRLSDVCEIFDGPHATPKLVDEGPIFLGISNLSNGRLDLTSTKHVSPQDFAKWTRRVAPTAGDVVFSYETRLGQASLIPKSLDCCLGRRMGLLRLITNKISPTLLLHAYMSPSFQETIRQRTIHGSTVDRIPLIELGNFPIRLPTGTDAATLTRMLEPLDAKIDANDRERTILTELRDLLLPKLMAGEIQLLDAEKALEAVA
jgi:type I restriction enzyme S subunit